MFGSLNTLQNLCQLVHLALRPELAVMEAWPSNKRVGEVGCAVSFFVPGTLTVFETMSDTASGVVVIGL